MSNSLDLEKLLMSEIVGVLKDHGLGDNEEIVKEEKTEDKAVINEAYVTEAPKFDLKTELLSKKNKAAHQELLEGYVKTLNAISAHLDSVDKDNANLNHSAFRQLKIDEAYNYNAAFLHGLFFQNISDLNSAISMNSLAFMRIERDFGSFDTWQRDLIACSLSSRNGWAIMGYSTMLKRYVNTFIDLHSLNCMIGLHPIIVLDCWEHSYYRDYLKDRKSYIYGMMKELDWGVIENRIKIADQIHGLLKWVDIQTK